jgi:tight adherence protein C
MENIFGSIDIVELGYYGLIFISVVILSMVLVGALWREPVQERLKTLGAGDQEVQPGVSPWVQHIVKLSAPIAKLSLPEEGWEASKLRIWFMNAGYRDFSAPVLFFAAKTLLTLLLPGIFWLYAGASGIKVGTQLFLILLLTIAAIGYFLPNIVLAYIIKHRKREIFESLPDALDLIMVCVEAGLGLDESFVKVAEEIRLKSPTLADELHLVTLDLRAGSSREQALHRLALRTGVEEVDSLVAMMIQSDRFGTSVADALRVQSDSLRTKRRQRAEEAAAKIPVKILFPVVFCIFPSLLVVLLGPSVIQVYRIMLPAVTGQG